MKKEKDWTTINEDIIAFKNKRMEELRLMKVERRNTIIDSLLGYE